MAYDPLLRWENEGGAILPDRLDSSGDEVERRGRENDGITCMSARIRAGDSSAGPAEVTAESGRA